MIKKQTSDENTKRNPMSDQTKGAIFLAMSVFAIIMVCIIIYARLDTTGQLQEKTISIQKKQSAE